MRTSFAALILSSTLASFTHANAVECSQCSQIYAAGTRSCGGIREPDRYNYCVAQAREASARCFRVCTNNGQRPPARSGEVVR